MEEYEIIVHTGSTDDSSATARIYLRLVGKYGRSEELLLSNSLTNSVPFYNGQMDIFKVKTEDVGLLQNCTIRQERTATSHPLYLEDVIIKKWGNSAELCVFPCNTWLSSDAEIVLQRLAEQEQGEYSSQFSVGGSNSESESISLSYSRTYSVSSSLSSTINASSHHIEGAKGSRRSFNSYRKSSGSGSSSSTLYIKTLQSVEGITPSVCESSRTHHKNEFVAGSPYQPHELEIQTSLQTTNTKNPISKSTSARRQSKSAPMLRPYSAPQLSQDRIQKYPKQSNEKQTFQTVELGGTHSQNSVGGFEKPTPLNEASNSRMDKSSSLSNTTEEKINLAEEDLNKHTQGINSVEFTHKVLNPMFSVVSSEKPQFQKFPLETGQKSHDCEDLQNINIIKRNIHSTADDGAIENPMSENKILFSHRSETQHEDPVTDITCRMPLPLYNIFLDLVRGVASSAVSDSWIKSIHLEHENVDNVFNPSLNSNESVEDNKVQGAPHMYESPTLNGPIKQKEAQHLLHQSKNSHEIVLKTSRAASPAPSNQEYVSSDSSLDLGLSETEEFTFSISSASDCLHAFSAQDVHEEMIETLGVGLEEQNDKRVGSSMRCHELFYRALASIKKNDSHQLENLCHNDLSILSATDTERRTLLHHAAAHGNVSICQVLLKDNIGRMQLDLQDMYGKTALHYAIQMHNSKVLKFLVNNEAKYDIADRNSQTVLDLAICLIEWHVHWEDKEGGTYPPIGWLPQI